MARLCPLFSGSSGNSYYIGSKEAGVLIDAGKNAKQIGLMLAGCGIDPLAVHGILITHEHSDHVSGLRVFAAKHGIPVFASQGTLDALDRLGIANGSFPAFAVEQNLQLADLNIGFFPTPHDSAESLGFRVTTGDGKRLVFATDLGALTNEVKENLIGCDFAVLESNHDVAMLQCGPYPYSLKQRILSDRGHLSNSSCAAFLPELHRSGVKKYLLAHLSDENNSPDLAYQTALCALTMAGLVKDVDFSLDLAPKGNHSGRTIVF